METATKFRLTGNQLKLLALITMTCDHIGVSLFPQVGWLRIVGRLALPIFAYMIAEGCHYTRNRRRYFLQLFALAIVCQIVYFIASGERLLSILFTFSLSILMIYALQYCKAKPGALRIALFLAVVAGVYGLNRVLTIDYGFWGCMVPVFAAAFRDTNCYSRPLSVTMLGIGLILLSCSLEPLQFFCLAALPLLYAYNGKRGKLNLKYFFYIFYPTHLVVLEGIAMLMRFFK